MKGLLVNVFGSDCTGGGATGGKTQALLCGMRLPEVFEATFDTTILVLDIDVDPKGTAPGRLLVPTPVFRERLQAIVDEEYPDIGATVARVVRGMAYPNHEGRSGMFGGNWIYSSDSRFPFEGPVPVYDRYER